MLGTGGFAGDRTTLWKLLTAKSTQYEHQHGEGMLPHAVAQNLANTLYGKRFFPYYCWNVCAGLDENGVGVVYSYDPVGNYERVRVSVTGSGESLIQPLLDNQLERQHQALGAKPPPLCSDLSLADMLDLVKDRDALLAQLRDQTVVVGDLSGQVDRLRSGCPGEPR